MHRHVSLYILLLAWTVPGAHGCGGAESTPDGADAPHDFPVDDTLSETVDIDHEEAEGEGCAPGLVPCGSECVDVSTDPDHCGRCDNQCRSGYVHTLPVCQNGLCGTACEPGWEDRDDAPGCESACVAAGDEVCNGLDDDCDGMPDDTFQCVMGEPVACLTTCRSVGIGECSEDCEPPLPSACTPPEEACNGFDDDCDGMIDEDFPPETCDLCTPDCADRDCGPDPVCGWSCGECTPPETCNLYGQCIPPCEPDCTGLECGPDPVCGLSCGVCTPPDTCSDEGQCVPPCVPDCTGLECGPDPVCGESCGECEPGDTCEDGVCVTPCVPNCAGRECGPDPACGESCGFCTLPETCNSAGRCVCVPDCSAVECGPDPICSISCGDCTPPEICNSAGMCVCVPDCTGLECGPDPVCSVSCGACTDPEECNAEGRCEVPGCPPPVESCTTGTQNRRGCSGARIIGRTAAGTGSGYSISDDTCYAWNEFDYSDCYDAGYDHAYRIYMLEGETIHITVDPWYDCAWEFWWDMTLHVITSAAGCYDMDCTNRVLCHRYISSEFNYDHTATQDGWVVIVVDGSTAFDDEGDYDFAVRLDCRDPGCGC
jgi:hypothetical protein